MTFTELLDKFGIEYRTDGTHHHARHGWINLDCPSCSPNWSHFRLGYNIYGGYMSCWSCGPKRTTNILMELTGLGYKELSEYIKEFQKDVIPTDVVTRGRMFLPVPEDELISLKDSPPHWSYLFNRNFDPDELEAVWGIKAIRLGNEYSWRVFIPVHYRGEIVSWTTRSISDNHAIRYRSARPSQEKINHKDLLYGEDYVRHTIIVCEGPTDVWAIGPGAVCTFGTGFKRSQITRISRYPRRVVCYDSERSASKRAADLTRLLACFDGDTYSVELDSKDPGSASPAEIEELRLKFLSD